MDDIKTGDIVLAVFPTFVEIFEILNISSSHTHVKILYATWPDNIGLFRETDGTVKYTNMRHWYNYKVLTKLSDLTLIERLSYNISEDF